MLMHLVYGDSRHNQSVEQRRRSLTYAAAHSLHVLAVHNDFGFKKAVLFGARTYRLIEGNSFAVFHCHALKGFQRSFDVGFSRGGAVAVPGRKPAFQRRLPFQLLQRHLGKHGLASRRYRTALRNRL